MTLPRTEHTGRNYILIVYSILIYTEIGAIPGTKKPPGKPDGFGWHWENQMCRGAVAAPSHLRSSGSSMGESCSNT